MMKYVVAGLFAALAVFIMAGSGQQKELTVSKRPVPSPKSEYKHILVNDQEYSYSLFFPSGKVFLVPNYSQKADSETINSEEKCVYGINGGFYDTAGNPLGWVISRGKVVSQRGSSGLLNTFLWEKGGNWEIGLSLPERADNGIQSGPLLIRDFETFAVSLARDKSARRMFAAVDGLGKVSFGTVFNEKAPLLGPYLSDLPGIVRKIAATEGLTWKTAINLDGGSASAFFGNGIYLKEYENVGSWWCFRNDFESSFK